MQRDAAARREFARINRRGTIPTFDIDGQVVIGFSPTRVRAAIDAAARRRARR